MQRKKMDKQHKIAENLKQHFLNNSEISNVDTAGQTDTKLSFKSSEDKLMVTRKMTASTSNNTNDSRITAVKRSLDLYDGEPPDIFHSRAPLSPTVTPMCHIGYDSSEPDYAQYPRDSVTKPLHHPNSVDEGMYNGGSLRMGSTSSYASTPVPDGSKRLSSFHYPPNINGSMSRTMGSTVSSSLDAQTQATPKSMSIEFGIASYQRAPESPLECFSPEEYMELTPQEAHKEYTHAD
ncbi:hypothetical protein Btru_053080 [Bulinus truncatus]|nr:hypothetical protein Btru_053080 [Bulinus truncatus]